MATLARRALLAAGLLSGCATSATRSQPSPPPAPGFADSTEVAAAAIKAFLATHPAVSAARVTTFKRKRTGVVVEVARSLDLPTVTDEGVLYCVDPQLGVTEIGGALLRRTEPDPVCREK